MAMIFTGAITTALVGMRVVRAATYRSAATTMSYVAGRFSGAKVLKHAAVGSNTITYSPGKLASAKNLKAAAVGQGVITYVAGRFASAKNLASLAVGPPTTVRQEAPRMVVFTGANQSLSFWS